MPSDFALKAMNAGHRIILKLSFGKLGWSAGSMPVLELTTVGRKSGQPRSVMLTSPIQQGDDVVVVASRGGDDHQDVEVAVIAVLGILHPVPPREAAEEDHHLDGRVGLQQGRDRLDLRAPRVRQVVDGRLHDA